MRDAAGSTETVRTLITAIRLREEAAHAERTKRGETHARLGLTHRDAVAALDLIGSCHREGNFITVYDPSAPRGDADAC